MLIRSLTSRNGRCKCKPLYTPLELEHQLNDSGASAIVIFANSAHVLEEVVERTSVKHTIITEVGDFYRFPKTS